MRRRTIQRQDGLRKGAVAAVSTICLIPLVGVMGMALDAGLLGAEHRKAQVAADAASYAAVCAWSESKSGDAQGDAFNAARRYAAANGFPNDGVHSTVTPSFVPNEAGAIQVAVTSHRPRLFSAIWDPTPVAVTARSTSKWFTTQSLYVLDKTSSSSLSVAGTAALVVAGPIQVNSSSSSAVDVNNSGSIQTADLLMNGNPDNPNQSFRAVVKVVGGAVQSSGGRYYLPVLKHSPASGDPLAATIGTPSTAGLVARTVPQGWRTPSVDHPLYPGVYAGGMSLTSGGMTYKLQPGVYHLTSGDFTVANGVKASGDGVTIYLQDGNFNIQGGSSVNLSAPTGGPYKNIVIHQKPYANEAQSRAISIGNGSMNNLFGTIYAPGAAVSLVGGSITDQGRTGVPAASMVVKRLNMSNNARIYLNGTSGTPSFQIVK